MTVALVTFWSAQEQVKGLQGAIIPERTLFIFPNIMEGDTFHSKNVLEPFDIAFCSPGGFVIRMYCLVPEERDIVAAPAYTDFALESKAGEMLRLNIVPGVILNRDLLLAEEVRKR